MTKRKTRWLNSTVHTTGETRLVLVVWLVLVGQKEQQQQEQHQEQEEEDQGDQKRLRLLQLPHYYHHHHRPLLPWDGSSSEACRPPRPAVLLPCTLGCDCLPSLWQRGYLVRLLVVVHHVRRQQVSSAQLLQPRLHHLLQQHVNKAQPPLLCRKTRSELDKNLRNG